MTQAIPRNIDLPPEQKLQAQFSLAAFSAVKSETITYISVPVSSGKRLYDFMDARGFKTPQEAKADHDAYFKNVLGPNIADGVKAAETWEKKLGGAVIVPARFDQYLHTHEALNWGQDAFMSMWIPMIDQKITHMVMADGWEYSNGSGEEYLQAVLMQMGRGGRADIKILDAGGQDIPLDKGIGLLADAFKGLHARGLQPRNMAETLGRLLAAEERYRFERKFHRSAEPDRSRAQFDTVPDYDSGKLSAIRHELRPLFTRYYPDIMPTLAEMSSFDYTPFNALFRAPAA